MQMLKEHQASVHCISSVCVGNESWVVGASTDGSVHVFYARDAGEFERKQTISLKTRYALAMAMTVIPDTRVPLLAIGNVGCEILIFTLDESRNVCKCIFMYSLGSLCKKSH